MPSPLLFAAAAAVNVVGLTANPCPPPIEMPAELIAWRAQSYAPTNHHAIAPPIAPAIAYRNAYLEARKTDWPDLCGFYFDNQKLIGHPQADRQVVFMGDSITNGWQYGDPAFFRTGWIDRGISGQTTQQMLLRFPSDVLALKPRVVHIMAGTNDIAGNNGPTSIEALEANIAAMVTLAKAAGIRVILAAVPPSSGFTWAPAIRAVADIALVNTRLKALAAREHIQYVDYGAVLAAPDGAMKADLTLDGTHPAAAGYLAMAPMAQAAIATALKR